MPEYPTTRLDRAIDRAIIRDNRRPRTPLVLCTVPGPQGEQCALQNGHAERVGNDHRNVTATARWSA